MRLTIFILIILSLSACEQNVQKADLIWLDGYWEIERVEFADGQSKEYTISTTVDYISYKDGEGYRKKVQPRLDGTFQTSDDAESFRIVEKKGKFIMWYANDLSEWEEEIVALNSERLVVAGKEGVRYHYKKFKPLLENR